VLSRRHLLAGCSLVSCGRSSLARIAVVPKATAHLFFVAIHGGVDRAAREFGIQVLWNGPNEETDYSRQIQIVDAFVAQRVDALAISATDERALVAPLERAAAAGIPVTVFDSAVDFKDYVTFVATDNHAAGCLAAREVGRLVSGQGSVAMVMQKPGGASTGLRERGFLETLAREFPGVRLLARQFGMGDRARSRAAAENILTAQPRLDALFGSSEAASIGIIQAVESRGLAGQVKIVGFDNSEIHRAALHRGTLDVMLVQEPDKIGYEAVRSLVRKLRGETPPQRLDLPVRRFTRENAAGLPA
jgi:ribose transport system substrate-binding protein